MKQVKNSAIATAIELMPDMPAEQIKSGAKQTIEQLLLQQILVLA